MPVVAAARPLTRFDFPIAGEGRKPVHIKRNSDVRSATRPVEKGDFAHMFLDDLLDDREAQAGAADAGRHVRLGQPLALLGKADAGIGHVDDDLVAGFPYLDFHLVAFKARFSTISPCFNCFNGVLDDIR